MHERMEFPWSVKEAEGLQAVGKAMAGIGGEVDLRHTTVRGVHGINYLERHDEDPLFDSDEEAQEYTRKALEAHDDLIEALQDARQFLLIGADADGPVSGAGHVVEEIEAALAKAGVKVTT